MRIKSLGKKLLAAALAASQVALPVSASAQQYKFVKGVPGLVVQSDFVAAPAFGLSTTSLAVGDAFLGSTQQASFAVLNTGNVALPAPALSVPAGVFSASHNCPATLQAGESCSATVSFSPTAVTAHTELLSVAFAGLAAQTVSLSGTGRGALVTADKASGDFGTVALGQARALTFVLSNAGNFSAPLNFGSLPSSVTRSGTCSAVLSAGAACTITLTYAPGDVTPVNSTLTVSGTTLGFTGSATLAAATLGAFVVLPSVYGAAPFALTAPTSSSTGAFSYSSSNPAVATLSNGTVTVLSAGSTTITATQAAAGNYAQASASAVLTVAGVAPTIGALAVPAPNAGSIPFTLSAPASNSPGVFTYSSSNSSVLSISGNQATAGIAGTTTVTATQAASGNFAAATASALLTVLPAGNVSSGSLLWSTPSNSLVPWSTASASCAGTVNGTTGWRLPTQAELLALYADRVAAGYAAKGWPTSQPYWGRDVAGSYSAGSHLSYGGNYSLPVGNSYYWTCVKPNYTTSANSLSFGSIPHDSSAQLSVVVTSTGPSVPSVPAVNVSGTQFTASHNCPASLPVGQSCTVVVTFTSLPAQTSTGLLSVGFAGATPVIATLTGTGQPLPGNVVSGGLTWATPPVTLKPWASASTYCAGTVNGTTGWRLPSQAELTALYANRVTANYAAYGWPSDQPYWGKDVASSYSGGYHLGMGSNYSLPVGNSYYGVCVKPDFTVSSSSAAFGSLVANTTGQVSVLVTSVGPTIPTVPVISVSGSQFSATHNCPASLPIGQTCTVVVTYASLPAQASSGTLSVAFAGPDAAVITLSGTGQPLTGAVVSGGLTWATPVASLKSWAGASTYCAGTVNGVTGWRLPSQAELTAIYANRATANFTAYGWPTDQPYWGKDVANSYSAGYHLGSGGNYSLPVGNSYYGVCVK